MRRVPPLPTLIVALAVAAMIALGLWQLHRRDWKEAQVARAAANMALPPVALPAMGGFDDGLLYRRVSAFCLQPTGWRAEAGRAADESSGWRHIATCRTGAEGPGFAVDLGVSRAPAAPAWRGGEVSGRLTTLPDERPLIARAFGRPPPPTPMIVSAVAAPGLVVSRPPDPADIPDNHLAYAIQWFLFAGVAATIYAVALWRRGAPPPAR